MHQPWSDSTVRVLIETFATDAMLASASPRKPSVATPSRSSAGDDLARRMRTQRQRQILADHARPIVGDSNALHAPLVDRYHDAPRGGIEAVLDQLLDDRRRALDDLACRDLIRDERGEYFDPLRHHAAGFCAPVASAVSGGACPLAYAAMPVKIACAILR